MLNELYTVHRSLEHFQVEVEESHPWVKRLRRGDVLIADVDANGLVTRVEHLGKQDAVTLFKIQKSFHANFPQVNWSAPLWKIDTDSTAYRSWQECPIDQVTQRVGFLREVCARAEISVAQARDLAHMREFCGELAPRFPAGADSEFDAFPTLIERILRDDISAEAWVGGFSAALLASVEQGVTPPAMAERLLAGDKGKVAVVFDLEDCTKFRCRVASPRMGGYFSQSLNDTGTAGSSRGRCALSGMEMPLETQKLPNPTLHVVGPTYLMAMNRDTPCQTRYGHIGMSIFPIGKTTASALDSALKHLTASEREGKNWARVPGNTRKKSNLLLVYLESAPDFEAPIAEMFTGGNESESLYAALCEQVGEALRGRAATDSELLHLFVLNKIDPGRVQVELSETFTASEVIEGSREWRNGAQNRPLLPLKEEWLVPSPAEVMRCLQIQWERGGTSSVDAPGCRLADVYDVLIAASNGGRAATELMLRLALRRTAELLMGIGHAAHRGEKRRGDARSATIAASVLGITLNKLGFRKETYMQDPAFLIGRFLSLTDTLHAQYCEHVRGGDMPPQLLGNALIPTAIGDPNKGFARMWQRLRPYQAWARGKKGTGLARWSCAEMGKIANEIAGKLPESRLSDAEQAQLLLGYLARPEKASEEGAQGNANE